MIRKKSIFHIISRRGDDLLDQVCKSNNFLNGRQSKSFKPNFTQERYGTQGEEGLGRRQRCDRADDLLQLPGSCLYCLYQNTFSCTYMLCMLHTVCMRCLYCLYQNSLYICNVCMGCLYLYKCTENTFLKNILPGMYCVLHTPILCTLHSEKVVRFSSSRGSSTF